MKHIAGAATTRTIVAMLVAAGAVAGGTIAPAASAAGCNDVAFFHARDAAAKLMRQATVNAGHQFYESAAAESLLAWRTMITGSPPCGSQLLNVRTHLIRSMRDYRQGALWDAAGTANGSGRYAAASADSAWRRGRSGAAEGSTSSVR